MTGSRGILLVAGVMALASSLSPASAAPARCHYRSGGALPDPVCTPGVSDPRVRETVEDTYTARAFAVTARVCTPGYAASVRPPTSYTGPLKREQMAAYHATGPPSAYQEDHLIPLELGGSPRSPSNLWPQPIRYAHAKDRVENLLHRLVCDHVISLWAARGLIATDWRQGGKR